MQVTDDESGGREKVTTVLMLLRL